MRSKILATALFAKEKYLPKVVINMSKRIYHCHACRYTYSSAKVPDRCPDCGAYAVRPATEEQIKDYERIRREIEEDRLCLQKVLMER